MPKNIADELSSIAHLEVLYSGHKVGTLFQASAREKTRFEYDNAWLGSGFSISPLSLPLESRMFETDFSQQDGLFGVFRDSLPDDWGRYVQDRRLAQVGIEAGTLTPLARLSLVGASGLGALEFSPATSIDSEEFSLDFDRAFIECQRLLDEGETESLDALYALGSSSGGARPKLMVDLDGEPWIVKFPAKLDGEDAGEREYNLALAARACGIEMSEVRLIPSALCSGFFAVKRFDRYREANGCETSRRKISALEMPEGEMGEVESGEGKDNRNKVGEDNDNASVGKLHMLSASAALECSPYDVIDYRDLMRLVLRLTGSVENVEQLYRVMCFNVLVGNCDDHARNFSFLYNENEKAWRLSPAYDLTQDAGFLGEHATLVNGKGADISDEDLGEVGISGGLSRGLCRSILSEMKGVLREKLVLDCRAARSDTIPARETNTSAAKDSRCSWKR